MKSLLQNRLLLAMGLSFLVGVSGEWADADPKPKIIRKVCDHLSLRGEESISFSDVETRLMCGDPKSKAWSNIPATQTLFHLRTFLQDRGYFLTKVESNDPLVVDLGKKSKINQVQWKTIPPEVNVKRIRGILGNVLTPKFLDQIKQRLVNILNANGYPCAKINLSADPATEVATIEVIDNGKRKFGAITIDPVPDLDPNVLKRYDAFHEGEPYNDDNLVTTTRRITVAGLVQSSHFLPNCNSDNDAVPVRNSLVSGPPRNLTIGFGVDTENYAHLNTTWSHLRLAKEASSFTLGSQMAIQKQVVNASSNWYYLPALPRHFLAPTLTFEHDDIPAYETLNANFQTQPSITWDTRDYGFTASLGPAFGWQHQYRPVPSDSYYSYVGVNLRMTSHDYEFYQTSPRSGSDVVLSGVFTRSGWLSNVSAQKLEIDFSHLWNFLHFDPPIMILGIRGGVSTTFVNDYQAGTTVPTNLKTYLGGSTDLRGFYANGVDINGRTGQGGLSRAFICFEARFFDLLPWNIQPFMFVDFGALGEKSLALDAPISESPGLGIRWESPLAVIRATLAHGYLLGDTRNFPPGVPEKMSHWTVFASFGQEF